MDKLPPVSYIRMVDIWLITVQLIPFILVILRTAMEIFCEAQFINHHGRNVPVNNGLVKEKNTVDIGKYLQLIGRFMKPIKYIFATHKIVLREEDCSRKLCHVYSDVLDLWNFALHDIKLLHNRNITEFKMMHLHYLPIHIFHKYFLVHLSWITSL